jgi:hypothetical protein
MKLGVCGGTTAAALHGAAAVAPLRCPVDRSGNAGGRKSPCTASNYQSAVNCFEQGKSDNLIKIKQADGRNRC